MSWSAALLGYMIGRDVDGICRGIDVLGHDIGASRQAKEAKDSGTAQGYLTVTGEPICSACRRLITERDEATWIFQGDRFIGYCGDACFEADMRKWLARRDEGKEKGNG